MSMKEEIAKIIRKETKVHHRVDGSAITEDDVAKQILSIIIEEIEKMPLLSDEEILKLIGLENYQNLVVDRIIAQAQREADLSKLKEE